MKVVINRCYGGFGVSREALHELRKMGYEPALKEVDLGEKWPDGSVNNDSFLNRSFFLHDGMERHDRELVEVVERMGAAANGACADLGVIEIPDGVDYEVDEYDGKEIVREKHRSWP